MAALPAVLPVVVLQVGRPAARLVAQELLESPVRWPVRRRQWPQTAHLPRSGKKPFQINQPLPVGHKATHKVVQQAQPAAQQVPRALLAGPHLANPAPRHPVRIVSHQHRLRICRTLCLPLRTSAAGCQALPVSPPLVVRKAVQLVLLVAQGHLVPVLWAVPDRPPHPVGHRSPALNLPLTQLPPA